MAALTRNLNHIAFFVLTFDNIFLISNKFFVCPCMFVICGLCPPPPPPPHTPLMYHTGSNALQYELIQCYLS